MSLLVDLHGTGKVDERKLEKILPELFRLTPTNIRRTLKLNRPIYRRTAAYGHFGRAPDKDGGFSWEKTDLVKELKARVLSALDCLVFQVQHGGQRAGRHVLFDERHCRILCNVRHRIARARAPSTAAARGMRSSARRRR